MIKNILMVGVGGQGIVLASNIASSVFLKSGYDVKKSEIHGMAQRGGSVVSHIRFGDCDILSPVIPLNEGDVILSFEQMEFLRYLDYVNPETQLIVNKRLILPLSVAVGSDAYPSDVVAEKKRLFKKVYEIDAEEIAEQAGNKKSASIPLLAELCLALDMDKKIWIDTITEHVPIHTLESNIKAFEKGFC